MTSELFDRLKNLAKKEGKIVFADDNDVFVILPLDEYEMLTDDLCGEECGKECSCGEERDDHNFDFGEEIFANNEDDEKSEDEKDEKADQELIKRVNEDIAKWREEQASRENIKAEDGEIKDAAKTEAKEDVLTEEERYYLEPLE